jgi:hypothetical protein
MTRRLIKNGVLTPDENAEPGIYWDQMGCPDVRLLCPTLDQLLEARKAGKVTQAALSGFLAIVKSYYEALGHVPHQYQGDCNVPIPIEVIVLGGEKLVGKARWSKDVRDARTATADKRHVKWQADADVVWLKHPKLSRTAVAKIIAPNKRNYVRQVIKKPEK